MTIDDDDDDDDDDETTLTVTYDVIGLFTDE